MNGTQGMSGRHVMTVVGCCLMAGIGFSVPMAVMSSFFGPIIETLGASATATTMYFTFYVVGSIPAALLGPRLLKRKAGLVVAACGAVTAAGLALLAAFPSVQMIWVAGALAGLTSPVASTLSVPILVANWFEKSQGTFLGVTMAFTGVGGALLTPLCAGFIVSAGWQATLTGLAACYAVVIVLTGALLVRYAPEGSGLLPYGASGGPAEPQSDAADDADKPGVAYRQIFKMPAFYVLGLFIALVSFTAAINQQANIMTQLSGFTVAAAALVVSCMSIGNVIGKVLLGVIKDRISVSAAGVYGGVCMVAGMAVMAFGMTGLSEPAMYGGAFVCGLGSCLGTMAGPLFSLETFGPRDYGTIMGTAGLFGIVGSAVAAPVISSFYDTTGSYVGAVVTLIVCAAVMVPVGIAAVKLGQRKWKGEAAKGAE